MKERNGRSEDRDGDGDKGCGYANFCFEVISGLDEMRWKRVE